MGAFEQPFRSATSRDRIRTASHVARAPPSVRHRPATIRRDAGVVIGYTQITEYEMSLQHGSALYAAPEHLISLIRASHARYRWFGWLGAWSIRRFSSVQCLVADALLILEILDVSLQLPRRRPCFCGWTLTKVDPNKLFLN